MDLSIIRKIARDAIRFDRVSFARSRILTVAHDIDRSFVYQGKGYAPLIDTIEDDLRRRGIVCQSTARIISRIKGERAYGNVVSPEGGFARALIAKRIRGALQRSRYPYSVAEERVWGRILDETGAEKVVAILPSRELCSACHKRGVWVADVQHGVIADMHPWYSKANRQHEPREWAPDLFMCWDPGSAAVIDAWGHDKGVRTVVIGNRWLARFLRNDPDDALVQETTAAYRDALDALGPKPRILTTLSWAVTNIPNGFMVDALLDTIRETADRFTWLVRLHPNHMNGFATEEGRRFAAIYDEKLRDVAQSDWVTRAPLPLVLRVTDLHVSWHSSVAIEAAQMGIKSAMLDPNLRRADALGSYYDYYGDRGLIDLISDDKASINRWIDANLGSRTGREAAVGPDRAYQEVLDFLADGSAA